MSNGTRFDQANAQPTLVERIRELLRQDDHVSFAELDRLAGFRGEFGLEIGVGLGVENIFAWTAVSEEAHAALGMMLRRGEFHFWPAELVVYLIDGVVPNLPIAKRARRYAQPRWLPVVLRRGPAPDLATKTTGTRRRAAGARSRPKRPHKP